MMEENGFFEQVVGLVEPKRLRVIMLDLARLRVGVVVESVPGHSLAKRGRISDEARAAVAFRRI